MLDKNPHSVTATQAKNQLGSLISLVAEKQKEVIIENHGEPTAVLISIEEYNRAKDLQEQARRQHALNKLQSVRERVRSRNTDIQTEDQAITIADQFVREVIQDMTK